MLAIYDQIQQLKAELNGCDFTRSERRQVQAELRRLIAEQAELDRALEALDQKRRQAVCRILNARQVGTKTAVDRVYIGRPSRWGNPFKIGRDGTRDQVIDKYRAWILRQPQLLARLHELKGKHLVCWCAPARCHGEVLIELANR